MVLRTQNNSFDLQRFLCALCTFGFLAFLSAPADVRAEEVLSFEALEIEGSAQKPLVAFIVPRSGKINLDVDIQRLKPAFSKLNLQLVRKHSVLFELKE